MAVKTMVFPVSIFPSIHCFMWRGAVGDDHGELLLLLGSSETWETPAVAGCLQTMTCTDNVNPGLIIYGYLWFINLRAVLPSNNLILKWSPPT